MAVLTNFGVPTGVAGDSTITLMPKLQYRFRVTFYGLGNSTSQLVTQNVMSATRPGLDHEDVTIDTYNSKIRLAGKHMWQDMTVVLRDDTNNNVIEAIRDQMNKQVNHADQSSPLAGSNYKFIMMVETLDGTQATGSNGGVIDRWTLEGAFIPSATFGDLNYATSEVVQVSMTIRFDNAQCKTDFSIAGAAATL